VARGFVDYAPDVLEGFEAAIVQKQLAHARWKPRMIAGNLTPGCSAEALLEEARRAAVVSNLSCCSPVVEFEQASQPLSGLDFAS
jgi:hypothetical protein